MEVHRVRAFTQGRDYGAFSVVRVSNGRLAELGGRNAWVAVRSEKSTIYRRVLGAGPANLDQDAIELDYDSRSDLGLKGDGDDDRFYPCSLRITQASAREKLFAHSVHPDPRYRVPFQLALLSVALGALSLALGVIGLVISIRSV